MEGQQVHSFLTRSAVSASVSINISLHQRCWFVVQTEVADAHLKQAVLARGTPGIPTCRLLHSLQKLVFLLVIWCRHNLHVGFVLVQCFMVLSRRKSMKMSLAVLPLRRGHMVTQLPPPSVVFCFKRDDDSRVSIRGDTVHDVRFAETPGSATEDASRPERRATTFQHGVSYVWVRRSVNFSYDSSCDHRTLFKSPCN